ncbi:MAG TPA: FkbM family methyltransferase [Blastocatellia bacterium]|nr:FkbM family methyltransferase [Blastocatellia bacterium]
MSIKRALVSRINQLAVVDRHVYTVRYGPARGLKRQGGMGWLPAFVPRGHEWEAEEAFLEQINWSGLTVYDVGGDQGIFTLFLARHVGLAGRVIVFEPNPRSYQRILTNVRLNGFDNVRVLPLGLGERAERLTFVFPKSEPARGSAALSVRTQVAQEQNAVRCEIEVAALDDEMARLNLPAPDLIKLDVEGMEWYALRGMRCTIEQHRPRLFIEIHGSDRQDKTANARRVVALIEELGYVIQHVETGTQITTDNSDVAYRGHLYCTYPAQ